MPLALPLAFNIFSDKAVQPEQAEPRGSGDKKDTTQSSRQHPAVAKEYDLLIQLSHLMKALDVTDDPPKFATRLGWELLPLLDR